MTFVSILQMAFALALTLGLFGVAVVAVRRYGPDGVRKLQSLQGHRRLKVVESVMLDPTRKLVLVAIDGAERLILTGDARFADAAPEERRRPAVNRKAKP